MISSEKFTQTGFPRRVVVWFGKERKQSRIRARCEPDDSARQEGKGHLKRAEAREKGRVSGSCGSREQQQRWRIRTGVRERVLRLARLVMAMIAITEQSAKVRTTFLRRPERPLGTVEAAPPAAIVLPTRSSSSRIQLPTPVRCPRKPHRHLL